MKLAYISNIRIPSRRAHSVQVMKMCEAFSRVSLPEDEKVEVVLVVAHRREEIAEDPFDFYGIAKTFTIKKLWCIDLPLGKFGHVLQLTTFALSGCVYALTHKADLIFTRDEIFAPLIALTRKKVLYEVHTRRDFFFNVFALKHIWRLVMISEGLKKYYIETYGISKDKILVAHDAVTPESFDVSEQKDAIRARLGLLSDRFVVGHLGKATTLGKPKGVEEIINAFAFVLQTHQEAFLFLAGLEEKEIPIMESLLQKAHVPTSAYKLVGHVPQKDFPPYFKACDALVMNYPNTEHYRLFMSPIKMFEYMASGVPIVTTDLPVVREVLDEADAWFVQPDNVDSLAHGITQVIEQKDEAAKRAQGAHWKVLAQYTWEKRAQAIFNGV